MASSYSTDLKLELMVTGENAGTWGDKTNTNLNLLDQAVTGYQNVVLTSTNTTLVMTNATVSNARNAVLKLTGTLSANSTVYVATGITKPYLIDNQTTGAYTLALNQVGGASVIWGTTDKSLKSVYLNGTDAVDTGIVSLTGVQTLSNKTLDSTNTANTITLNTPKILNTGSIVDANTNPYVTFAQTTSAVNQITVTNAATTNNPSISATGTDSNVGLTLAGKGTGLIKLTSGGYFPDATLTFGTTITWDVSTSPVAKVTLTASTGTLSAPTNSVAGQFISLTVIQDGTGSRTLTWNSAYSFTAATAPTLTTTASQGDLFVFKYDGTKWLCVGTSLNLVV